MTGHVTEIAILGVLAFAGLMGLLELLWWVLESGKSAVSSRTE